MKSRIFFVFFSVLAILALNGFGPADYTDAAKNLLKEYYACFENAKSEEAIGKMHDSLVQNLGGKDGLKALFDCRMAILGKVIDYKIEETGFHSKNLSADVNLTIKVNYQGAKNQEEKFIVSWFDGKPYINSIFMKQEPVTGAVISSFFKNFGNIEKMSKSFLPSLAKNPNMQNALKKMSDKIQAIGGAFKDFKLIKPQYKFVTKKNFSMIYYSDVLAKFEKINLMGKIEIAKENTGIGLNLVDLYPEPILAATTHFYSHIKKNDIDGAMKVYSNEFFASTPGGREAFKKNVLNALGQKFGPLQGYRLGPWKVENSEFKGKPVKLIVGFVDSIYGKQKMKEVFTVAFIDNQYKLVGHRFNTEK